MSSFDGWSTDDIMRSYDRARLQAFQYVLGAFEDFSDPATARDYLLPVLRSEVERLSPVEETAP